MTTLNKFMGRTAWESREDTDSMQLPLPNALVGIEVEVDWTRYEDAPALPSSYAPLWEKKHDGSLVNGCEYVLASPRRGADLVESIHALYQDSFTFPRSYTGSTHIHINVLDGSTTVEGLRTLALLCYAFENLLYYVGDNSRKWCGYANRLVSAPSDVLEQLLGTTPTRRGLEAALNTAGRYYGLNLAALYKYGSVEFRYFPTARDAQELLEWISLVQLFKKAADEAGTLEELTRRLSTKEGYDDFVSTYFSAYQEQLNACTNHRKVRSLMSKALIIATSQRSSVALNKQVVMQRFPALVKKYSSPPLRLASLVFDPLGKDRSAASAPTGDRPGVYMLFFEGEWYAGYIDRYHTEFHWTGLRRLLSLDAQFAEWYRGAYSDILASATRLMHAALEADPVGMGSRDLQWATAGLVQPGYDPLTFGTEQDIPEEEYPDTYNDDEDEEEF